MAGITKYSKEGDQNGKTVMAIAMIMSMTSSGIIGGLPPQASQAAASALAPLLRWAAGVIHYLAGQSGQSSNSVIRTTTITPEKPFLVQTQNFNFRVTGQLVQNAANYTYVTPAGNYTFSKTSPIEMSYVSLFGNRTALSAFHVQEKSLLAEGAEKVLLANQTTFEDSAQQLLGQTVQGTLTCTYSFKSSPEATKCAYVEATGITASFNIGWATSGNYIDIADATTATEINATATSLVSAGNSMYVHLGNRPDATTWERSLLLDWSDTGVQAQVSYGPLGLTAVNAQTEQGVLVTFPSNLATVDPSLYQENYGSQSRSCAFTSSVTKWDTLLYAGNWYEATPTDSLSSLFGGEVSDSNSVTVGGTTAYVYSEIYTAVSAGTGSDTITSTGGYVSTTDSGQVFCYDLQYTDYQQDAIQEGTYQYTGGTGTGPITTGNMQPASNDFVLSYLNYGLACGLGSAYATGGWSGSSATAWLYHDGRANVCGTGKDYYVASAAVYANAWSSGSTPTDASMSVCGPSSSGVCLAVETQESWPEQGIVPFTATLDSIGSPQTITISGDGRQIPSFVGNGSQSDDIRAIIGGTVTLTLPLGYVWDRTNNGTLNVPICSPGGICSSSSATYRPILDYMYTVQLTNSQSSATPATFQQAVQIPVSTLGISSYLASDIGNVVFCADLACATPLYAWIQDCQGTSCTTSSTYVDSWVKLTTSIPADSYTDIYMAILPSTTEFNSYWGEAPQISSTYGKYDNGASVFTFYANFAGTTFNKAVWGHSIDGTASIIVDNGLTLTAYMNGGDVAVVTHSTYSGIFDAYMLAPNFPPNGDTFRADGAQVLTTVANGTAWELGNGYGTECYMHKNALGVKSADIYLVKSPADSVLATDSLGTSGCSAGAYGTGWPSTGQENSYNGSPPSQLLSATDSTYTHAAGSFGLAAQGTSGSSGNYDSGSFYYVRVRAYPPAGVMPTVQIAPETTLNVEPSGAHPLEAYNSLVNLTGSTSKVLVTLNSGNHNNLNGGSCGGAPCTPPSGNWSFQFNILFPKFLAQDETSGPYIGQDVHCTTQNGTCKQFMVQATVEAYQNGTCKAEAQGAPSSLPAPDVVPQDSFSCGDITAPGDNFAWVVDSTVGTTWTLNNIEFQINGVTNATWNALGAGGMFTMHDAPSSVIMNDAYAQSSFTGGLGGGSYGNFYSGGGSISYTGVENAAYNSNCHVCEPYAWTGEYSNTEYTSIPDTGTSFNQTFNGGAFANVYEGSSGSVTNGSYSIGPPSGQFAELQALTSGSTACLEDAFVTGGPVVDGTIAIYGNSKSGDTSNVQVAVSTSSSSSCSSGTGWTTIYTGSWSSSTAAWIPLNSTSQVEYIKITASYSGTPADIYIGSISMFMGSYGESQTNSNTGVTTPGYALGVNDGHNAVLQATSANPTAWIQIGFGTLYSGDLLLRGYLSSGSNSSVTVEVSSTGAPGSFEPVPNACNWKGSATWVDCSGISQALYVLIEVSYGHPGNAELYLDAVYIA